MTGQYKVFPVGDKFEIYWCPSAPIHFNDKVPYDGKLYSKKQAAYRRAKQLSEARAVKAGAQVKEEAA